ncbi:hypothetical protein ACP275_12G005500 [Erythranthe tilingii]
MVLRKQKPPRDPPFFSAAAFKVISILLLSSSSVEGIIGISWGRQTTHRLIPSMVVDLLLQNGIRHVKLFSPSDNVLKAFAGGEIAVTMTLPNEGLYNIGYPDLAAYWLQTRIRAYQDLNVNIKYLYVGSEPFSTYYRKKMYINANEALRSIQDAIAANGYKDLVATTPHFTDMLDPNIRKPSEADFHPDWKGKMVEFVGLLNRTNAPFVMDMFPMYSVSQMGWDTEFAFVDNKSNFTIVDDNGLVYRNVFEFFYDSFLTAIAKAGAPHLKLMVGQVGWPTDGYPEATTANAERFFRGLLPFVTGTKGTPLRPGISIDVFIYSLADENLNKLTLGGYQRHWGVYRSDGDPKFKIDFTGKGQEIFPTTAKGVVMMPKRWCVFNGDKNNLTKVKEEVEDACMMGDCTPSWPGGSCDNLDFDRNVSYAFNGYFQAMAQSIDDKSITCDFKGLGKVVVEDPSVGSCRFPMEILSAEMADSNGLTSGEDGERCRGFFGLFLLIIFVLELNWGHGFVL